MSADKPCVLLVEDEHAQREVLAYNLEAEGFRVGRAENGEEADMRRKLNVPAHNLSQDIYVSKDLPTGRVMVKDEDVCLHCGLCAERCPTSAWDMQKFLYMTSKAGDAFNEQPNP